MKVPMKVPIEEAIRYLRADPADRVTRQMAEEMAAVLEEKAPPRFIDREFSLERREDGVFLPEAGLLLPGKMAEGMLRDCEKAVLLACTLGAAYEQAERTWRVRDMARAAVLNACGSAFVEVGCEEAERTIQRRHPELYLTDRFSPGYGDLPLSVQEGLLRALGAEKYLGIQLTPSFLMIPSKSVTAVIGLAATPQGTRIRGCAYCGMKDTCEIRKGGRFCGADA